MSARTARNNNRVAIIDADGILYAASLNGETTCEGAQLQLLSDEAIYANAVDRLEEQIRWTGAEDSFVCLSDRRNFRVDILETYKGQRKATPRPLALDTLRARFADNSPYRVLLIKTLEADDVCGITAGVLQKAGKDTVIVSPDKDLLQIPGKVITPMRGGLHPLTNVTLEMANRWHLYQTLVGDTCDNYKGCPGWGARKAGNFLDQTADLSLAERWGLVQEIFVDAGLTREDCLVQARVSRILRAEDWDTEAKEPRLFEFPTE